MTSSRFLQIKNFITAEQCEVLNEWTRLGVEKHWLDAGFTTNAERTTARLTTRVYADRFKNIPQALQISSQIRKHLQIEKHPLIFDHGLDGIVVSYTKPGGDVYEHQDPRSPEGLSALRCNILTQAADAGGELYVDGIHRPIGVGDLHCYLASDHKHFVTTVQGQTPRILWMFGAYVPPENWNSGQIAQTPRLQT